METYKNDYAKKDSTLSELISESTNNQIPVVSRDLKANDLIQKNFKKNLIH